MINLVLVEEAGGLVELLVPLAGGVSEEVGGGAREVALEDRMGRGPGGAVGLVPVVLVLVRGVLLVAGGTCTASAAVLRRQRPIGVLTRARRRRRVARVHRARLLLLLLHGLHAAADAATAAIGLSRFAGLKQERIVRKVREVAFSAMNGKCLNI